MGLWLRMHLFRDRDAIVVIARPTIAIWLLISSKERLFFGIRRQLVGIDVFYCLGHRRLLTQLRLRLRLRLRLLPTKATTTTTATTTNTTTTATTDNKKFPSARRCYHALKSRSAANLRIAHSFWRSAQRLTSFAQRQ